MSWGTVSIVKEYGKYLIIRDSCNEGISGIESFGKLMEIIADIILLLFGSALLIVAILMVLWVIEILKNRYESGLSEKRMDTYERSPFDIKYQPRESPDRNGPPPVIGNF